MTEKNKKTVKMDNIEVNAFPTRMHSSGMRTARLLTVSSGKGCLPGGGVSARGGVPGGVCPGGVCPGGCLLGWCLPRALPVDRQTPVKT